LKRRVSAEARPPCALCRPHGPGATPFRVVRQTRRGLLPWTSCAPVALTKGRPAMSGGAGGAGGEEGGLYPIAVLIDELKHEDVQLRLNSIKRLDTIATALGVERTRTELIPFLNESVDDDDEVLLVLAEELGNFVDYVGGPSHAHTLLVPLEGLATVEEMTVREKAVGSLNAVCKALPDEDLMEHFVPLLHKLATKDWFTARISACGLFAAAYSRIDDASQRELRKWFASLCRDDAPMVRRAASSALAGFVERLSAEEAQGELLPLAATLSSDEQDSVRLLAVENCVALCGVLNAPAQVPHVLPMVLRLAGDKSWRVRWSVANKITELLDVFATDAARRQLVDAFEALLRDTEAEVRSSAAGKVTDVAEKAGPEVTVSKLIPQITRLVTDDSEHVRASLAKVIMGCAAVLGKDQTIVHLLPRFLELLKDSTSDVRLNLISKLEDVNSVIGVDLLSNSLLPAIMELAEDKQWRVRLAIIEFMPLLAGQLGQEFFEARELTNLCLLWLGDSVHAVRETAANTLAQLTTVFGSDWAAAAIVPRIRTLNEDPNYLLRMTSLAVARALADAVSQDHLHSVVLPSVLAMARDPVPNVRFMVAKVLKDIIPKMEARIVASQAKPCLQTLSSDSDLDVKYYASQALAVI